MDRVSLLSVRDYASEARGILPKHVLDYYAGYVDGGIRRVSDVLKALALGARAALVGRPILWGDYRPLRPMS